MSSLFHGVTESPAVGGREDVLTEVAKARPATAQRQSLEELQLPSIFVIDVLRNCGFGGP